MTSKDYRTGMKIILTAFLLTALTVPVFLLGSCTKTLDGDVNANQKPIVYFVNIPPEGQQFSRNPVVHWVGTDRDGLIAYFQYYVTGVDEMGGMTAAQFAPTISDDQWIRLDVDPQGPDPKTSNVIAMSADLDDPVNSWVDQYVFLQAYDEEGLGSDYAFRLFSRNDNPPETGIFGIAEADLPFINSVNPGGIITGVRVRWFGEDPIDYPADPPPFQYHWRLYGPYSDEDITIVRDEFIDSVFLTADGRVLELGDTLYRCESDYVDSLGEFVETCDTLIIPDTTLSGADGTFQMRFSVDDPDFLGHSNQLNRIALESGDSTNLPESKWVFGEGDTLWNAYNNPSYQSDTTVLMNFVFWVRSRDDAFVPDLVPAYREFQIIDPRYERDVVICDFNSIARQSRWNAVLESRDTTEFNVKNYWHSKLKTWALSAPYFGGDSTQLMFDTDIVHVDSGLLGTFQSAPDYFYVDRMPTGPPISELLKHKVIILYNDNLSTISSSKLDPVYKAVDAGINLWATWRCPTVQNTGIGGEPILDLFPTADYSWYFGVEQSAFMGFVCYAWTAPEPQNSPCSPSGLFHDFNGTISLIPEGWPELNVSEDNLFNRYEWTKTGFFQAWDSNLVALPEVDWSQTAFGTEVIYLYRSLYGQAHPLGPRYAFQGRPVGHRKETSLFRTVHFNFTPPGIEDAPMQQVLDSVLNWLYDPDIGASASSSMTSRYPGAPVRITIDDARENVRRREAEQRDE